MGQIGKNHGVKLIVIAYVNSAGNLAFIHCSNTMCAPYFRGS